jgi:hypothetical protein
MSETYENKQIYYINSHFKNSGSDSDFIYTININNNLDVDSVVLLDCSIPKSFYMIQDGTNTFTLVEGSYNTVISVTPGNYSRVSLKNTIQVLLNDNTQTGFNYIVSYSSTPNYDDGKFIFTVSNNSGTQPQFIFTNYLYEQLGFNKNTTYTFQSNILTSINVINLQTESTLFLRSNICDNEGSNILQNIISTGNADYSFIIFQNNNINGYSKKLNTKNINSFYFKLTNEDNEIINLNGLNIVFTIMIYKSNQIDNLIKGYIKYKTLENIKLE